MTLKDLKKIDAKLTEALEIVTYVLGNQGDRECSKCKRTLPIHRYYKYCGKECKDCKIKRSKAYNARLKEAKG